MDFNFRNFLIIRRLSFFVVISLLGLMGCRVNCPEFDEKILQWIPYQENDVIELYSQSNDSTIIFTVKSVIVTHTTHYSQGSKCGGCSDDILIYDDAADFQVDISLYKNKIEYQSYWVCDTYFSDYSEVKNYLFENEEYDIVRIFDNNGSTGTFRKMIIAKEIGVIGLIDIYGNTWALKIGSDTKRKNIVINNVSC